MPKRKKISVVIDVNWYVSACINRNSRHTLYHKILKNPRLQIFYSRELLEEFEGVMTRRKFSKIISPNQVTRFKAIIFLFLTRIQIQSIPQIVRDKEDNYLLGICDVSKADFLITGDEDLLVLGKYESTIILTMGQFLNILPPIK
jgi:putative PIN family toxin of toxin-antitoxin system